MPLHLTKISYRARTPETLRNWLEGHDHEALLTTRFLPKRQDELIGGSLFWIMDHALIGRSPIVGFGKSDDGRGTIRLKPQLITVQTMPRRAHQGWRYLQDSDAPPDLEGSASQGDALPPRLIGELAKLGLV